MERVYPYFLFLLIVATGYLGVTQLGITRELLDVNLLDVVLEILSAAMYLAVFLFCAIGIFTPLLGTFVGFRLGVMAAPRWAIFGGIIGSIFGMLGGYLLLERLLMLSYDIAGAENVMPQLPLPPFSYQGDMFIALSCCLLLVAGVSRRFIFKARTKTDTAEEQTSDADLDDLDRH